jgi:hypothetical protein
LISIGGARAVDAGGIGCSLADEVGNKIDPLLRQFLAEGQIAE